MPKRDAKSATAAVCIAAAVCANLLWSTSFVSTKLAYASFAPLTLGMVRHAAAALLLGIIVSAQGAQGRRERLDQPHFRLKRRPDRRVIPGHNRVA